MFTEAISKKQIHLAPQVFWLELSTSSTKNNNNSLDFTNNNKKYPAVI